MWRGTGAPLTPRTARRTALPLHARPGREHMEPIDLLVAFLSGGAAVKSPARRLTGTKRGRLEHEAPDDKPERRVSQTLAAHTADDDVDGLVWSLDELVEASESRKNSEDDKASESVAALSRSSSCYTAVSSSGEASPGRGEP